MKERDDNKNPFQIKNKFLSFLIIFILTITITRILTYYNDLDLMLFGYELHHFYYGITILVIVLIAVLFGNFHKKLYLGLSAVGLGLVADEFLFILGGFRNSEYPSTVTHMIYTVAVVLIILGIILYDFIGKIKQK